MIEFRTSFLAIAALIGVAPPPAQADVDTFQTPSHNIQCTVGMDFNIPSDIECEISQTQCAPALPRPADCKTGWGHNFRMRSAGPVTIACADPLVIKPEDNVFEYGRRHDFLGIFCTSSRRGLHCRNRDGHGFSLSRTKQIIY
ncbi:MAG: DUF6636 domain-containing protein [Methylocella sp.]